MDIGEKIRELREEARMKQLELAHQLTISPQSVSLYENNHRTPDIEMLVIIADFFDVSLDYITGRSTFRGIAKKHIIEFDVENELIRDELIVYHKYLVQKHGE
jgi:transcriptional regulator with XRE-family HTH domain